jgi:hypothetical protein
MAPRPLPKPLTLKSNHLTPGNCVYADHYFSPVPSHLPHTFGKEHVGYTWGSLFVDHASGKIFNFPQYSNNASETIQCAQCLESMAWDEGFKIKAYHSDNGIFAAADLQEHCKRQQQKFSFSGVDAKHQKGIAEWNIKTVVQWARINMLHLATHWPAEAHKRYWPQAIDYAVWVFNCLPNSTSGISPNKLWSQVRHVDKKLHRVHVFRCPVYVLDASLQHGKKIPKWNPWARLGYFLGFSDLHSSLVPLVLNVDTGHISLQFHVIFDNKFETVTSLAFGEPLDKQWANIFWLGRECFLDVGYDVNDQPILPLLLDIIKSYSKAKADQPNFEPGCSIDFDGIMVNNALVPPPHHELSQDDQAVTPLQSQATSQAAPPPTLHPVPRRDFYVPSIPVMPVPGGWTTPLQ